MIRFFARKLSKEDVFEMYRKKDLRALLKALKDKDPEIRLEAVHRLESLAKDESFLSVREIIEHDILRALPCPFIMC
jgi:HEAT repeat protein